MDYFSVKMRSSLEENHISGHERIVKASELENTISELFKRGSRKPFDFLNIKIEKINSTILFIKKTLKIKTLNFNNTREANNFALNLLQKETGINQNTLQKLIKLIHTGAASGKNMRGAMIVNLKGERIEKDREKGIRTTMVDYTNREENKEKLIKKGFTERTLDALALSTKNLIYPDIVAEYCISDEPDYLTGYVATKRYYFRLTPLKEKGNLFGGRIYFVKNNTDIDKLYQYLQNTPVLIEDIEIE